MGDVKLHIVFHNKITMITLAVTDSVLSQDIIGRKGMDQIIPGWYERLLGNTKLLRKDSIDDNLSASSSHSEAAEQKVAGDKLESTANINYQYTVSKLIDSKFDEWFHKCLQPIIDGRGQPYHNEKYRYQSLRG